MPTYMISEVARLVMAEMHLNSAQQGSGALFNLAWRLILAQ
jgi:hypothetical protein